MITFPNAKINLGLNITGKRPDGLHNIETILYPVPLCDILEVIPTPGEELHFQLTGLQPGGDISDNLCLRAYAALKERLSLPSVSVHLHKMIPAGAGMGGGSSDGAFSLKVMNALVENGLSMEQLKPLAEKLGSDCPFFLINQPCFATGTGTELTPIGPDLSGCTLIIVKPACSVNTGWAYSCVKAFSRHESPDKIVMLPLEEWKERLFNDFEEIVFPHFPEIKRIKEQLYEMGADYASMSGSGSSVFGIFREPAGISVHPFGECFCWTGRL